jgi:hypothetical protein
MAGVPMAHAKLSDLWFPTSTEKSSLLRLGRDRRGWEDTMVLY